MPLLPCFTCNQALKKTIEVSNVMFIYRNNAAKPHSCGDKDLKNKFSVVVSHWDNVKTKDSSQTFISEDLSWDIISSNNCYILSQ